MIAVSDAAGNASAINRYDEYGIPQSGNIGRFQYTGQKWLPSIGMYDYKARMYSPTLGRFLQTDPIGYADGINWYNYVGSDPVNASDPSGLVTQQFVNCAPAATSWNSSGGDIVGTTTRCETIWIDIPDYRDGRSGTDLIRPGGGGTRAQVGNTATQNNLRRPDTCSPASFGVFEAAANAAYANNPARLYHLIFPFSALRGMSIHSEFAGSINATGGLYRAEVSYKNGVVVPYGTSGSVRADGVFGPVGSPEYVVELKSGLSFPTPSEIDAYRRNLPAGTKVCAIVEAPGAP